MVELKARAPFEDMEPLSIGQVELAPFDPGTLTLIAPFRDRSETLTQALAEKHGLGWPEPGHWIGGDDMRLSWFGAGRALLMGGAADPSLEIHASLVDQSDGWAALVLRGWGAEEVLARLVPLDLREAGFPAGRVARSRLQHVDGAILRLQEAQFLILGPRSMAGTLRHDLVSAMESRAARG